MARTRQGVEMIWEPEAKIHGAGRPGLVAHVVEGTL